jgi:hypothetical protein
MADLVEHLRAAGLHLRVVPGDRFGTPERRAYLTTTDLTWRDLDLLPKVPERLAAWKGSVYCERNTWPPSRDSLRRQWGEGCRCIGPFLFFGDPDLLGRIETALGAPRAEVLAPGG